MLRSRIIWHRSQKRRILCGRSATTSRGVLEAYSSQKPQSAMVRLSMWKGAPNNAEGKAKQCSGVMMSFCSILLRFLNRTFQNAEIRCSVWKQTEAHWSIAAAKRMNWKWSSVRSDCEFGDMNGVLVLTLIPLGYFEDLSPWGACPPPPPPTPSDLVN